MSTIVTRAGKGSPLTHAEVDANFTNLNTDKVEKTSAAITGGTINGTTIGATTPSTVNATTLSGQTARLNGTGQNLLVQSQSLTSFGWAAATALTINTTATTAPNGTTTGNSLTPTVANSFHRVSQSSAIISGITYTLSFFAKANGYKYLALNCNSAFNAQSVFDVDAGTVFSTGSGTASITSVGSGWYRCIITGTATSSTTATLFFGVANTSGVDASYAGDGTSGIFGWGAQLEFGSTANTYIPTTTTAVYGTPTLSFSGVSTLGLESNGALFLQPAGTGAIQAQATTSTTAGGNVRGANAVDWQTARGTAAQVASGQLSFIGGGTNNTASQFNSTVAGGFQNTVSNVASFIGAGSTNTASGGYGGIVTGVSNTAAGVYNFIGGGFTNSGTSGSAVTTQSGTMNATTAVTLSGSNASIKVGQLITGTSIAGETYVAAISGTALTLSKNASGSSTSTLSFFTPHGVVVGGGNNQATGSYSFIGGGGDAGTAANRNVASGAWSTIAGGARNTASGAGSTVAGGGTDGGGNYFANTASGTTAFIGGGWNNTASSTLSVICGGTSNTASATESFIGGGLNNTVNGVASAIMGGRQGTARGITGNHVFSAQYDSISSGSGVAQSALLVLGRQTTDATPTVLASSNTAAGTNNQVILPNNSAYLFKATVISNVTGGGNTSGWKLEGVIKRGANAASTTIVGLVTTTLLAQDAGAATWAIAATADTTNGGLRITFTGQASTTIRTVCKVETTEVTF